MKKIVLSLLLGFSVLPALGQAQTGLYPYGSFDTPGFDTIDRGSLNVHFSIPVVSKQGRGVPFQYQLVYDSLVWSPVSSTGAQTWTNATGWGLHGQIDEGFQGYLSYFSNYTKCYQGGSFTWETLTSHYVYHDAFGVSHPFTYQVTCTGASGGGPSTDGSGYSYSGGSVTAADGKQINAPVNNQSSSGTITDTNGNVINNNGNGTFTDTIGKTALNITGSGTAASPRVFTYSTPTSTATVTVSYKTYAVRTNFGCAATDYNLSQDLVDRITLGDNSFYQFGYEATPGYSGDVTGRLASLTLPQGGTITYQYTGANNGIVCADGTPTGLTRTITGGSRTYVRSSITATSSHTDITDGLTNDLGFDFVMAGAPEAFYETNRNIHQGSSSGPVLLSRQTCYNKAADPCTTTAIVLPVTQIDTYETLNGGLQHGSTLTYNSFGLQTSETDYDFGTASSRGSALRAETWAYPSSGLPLLQSDSVLDGSNNQISFTVYYYDETMGPGHAPLVNTSGLPQHLAETGQRGNLTTIRQYPNNGASYLTTAAAYEDTGNALNVTGPTGVSTYAYDPATHAFTTTATPPTPSSGVSLPSSAANDANSGVLLSATDPNKQMVSYASYDPLLRPTQINYPDGGMMTAGYTATQTGVYNYMTASTHTNTQTSQDSYGRPYWVAVQNTPGGNYYWNNYCYDGNGNLQYAAYRFVAANQGNLSCSGAGDSYIYDALGRVKTITHADSSTINYSYNGRATQVTDENGVSRIIQVDGLGRPTTVCEVSSVPLYGVSPVPCGLDISPSPTGFLTTYTYLTDTTNANALETKILQGAQTRIFETDWLGRTIQVTEPESGKTTYSYAYSTTAGYGLTVTRVRPQANQTGSATTTTTTQYDSIGRVVTLNYTDGTPNRAFGYDTNCCWAQGGANVKGRLAGTGGRHWFHLEWLLDQL